MQEIQTADRAFVNLNDFGTTISRQQRPCGGNYQQRGGEHHYVTAKKKLCMENLLEQTLGRLRIKQHRG